MSKGVRVYTVDGYELRRERAEDRARLAELKVAAIRLRNFGASPQVIADTLKMTETDAEAVLTEGLRELVADDAAAVRGRQQAVLNDIKRAMYPGMAAGDEKASGMLIRALDHELKLHPGAAAPTRVHVGMDEETFTTRVDDDLRRIGLDPARIIEPAPAEEDGEPWANT